jgi:hypothetical protein
VNDDLRFMDDMDAHDLAAAVPMEVKFSYDFADVLTEPRPSNSAFDIPHSALGEGS